jgi:hypothetical protein
MPLNEVFQKFFHNKKENENPSQLKGEELKKALAEAASQAGMKPETVQKFLQFEETESVLKPERIAILFVLIYVVLQTAVNVGAGESLDASAMSKLPSWLHEGLQVLYGMNSYAAGGDTWRQHFPLLMLTGGGALAASGLIERARQQKKREKMALKVKSALEGEVARGEVNLNMPEGHSAFFSGNGDPYVSSLQKELGISDVVTYTTNPNGDTSLTKQGYELSSTEDTLEAALERGDFVKAGEVGFFPVIEQDQFLPDPDEDNDSFDTTLSDMDVMIAKMENFLKNKQDNDKEKIIKKKKLIIVSSKNQKETKAHGREKIPSTRTLEDLQREQNEKGENDGKIKYFDVEIVDPTELVFDALMPLLGGKTPDFIALTKSANRYTDRFYAEYDARVKKDGSQIPGMRVTSSEEVRVFYNISDVATIAQARKDDIAIVSSERHKQVLLDQGVNPDRIIVISKLVKTAIKNLTNPVQKK